MSKKATENRRVIFGVLAEMFRLWRTRPNRRRDWQVIATFGGAGFTLRKVRENELPEKLAGSGRIVYIDSVHGFVFIDDGSRPGKAQSPINH